MPWLLCRDCATLIDAATAACPTCGSQRTLGHPELASLSIAHVDCDAFYASVEKRDAPHLAPLPLIVGHPGGRGVVTTACYIARRFGIRSAMPMFQALERCPEAVVIPPNMAKYKAVSSEIREIFRAATPIIEPVSLDEAYLDLADEHRLRGTCAAEALAEIARRVEREVGITVSIGLAANKFMAKLASELRKPAGFSVIGEAEAIAFLAPLSVRKIHGVGSATAKRMEEAGFNTIGDLQALPAQALVARYGKFGSRLAQFVRGEDSRTVTPDRPTKSISAETTFRRDTSRFDELLETGRGLATRVAAQLARKGLAAGTVVLKLKTADFKVVTRNRRLAHPTQKAAVLSESAEALLAREVDGRFFRLLGIGAADLRPAVEADPVDLFGFAEQGGTAPIMRDQG
ncbi:MAG: DNA polymerase IV [Hyphomicrobiales bacterium]|nr:MAG: DNA polymerase IV [Hyphomicrobiales bacterium]